MTGKGDEEMIKLFSAFAGYGTDNFALKHLGIEFECVGFSEIDKYAIQCFEKNHCHKFPDMLKGDVIRPHNFGDISKIDWNIVPDFDLITGGFPCQDVSVAGKKDLTKGRTILGMELTKALKIKQPKYFLFENVKGLMSKKFQEFREQLIKSWEDCGYKIYFQVMNTKDYGIPQSRARVFFVGIRNDINQNFIFPEKEELKIFIKDILEKEVDNKYLLKEHQVKKLLEGIEKKNRFIQSKLQTQDYDFALKGRDFKEPKVVQIDISGKGYRSQQDRFYNAEGVMCCLPNAHPDDKVNIFALRSFPRTDNPEQDKIDGRFQNMEVRYDGCSNSLTSVEKDNLVMDNRYKDKGRIYDGVSPTLNSHGDTKGAIFRRLTPRECFRLQGFLNDEINLDGLSDTQAYRLAGNGQSVNVVSKILKELLQGN